MFDRDDGIIVLCEIKYSEHAFVIDKTYAKSLLNKIDLFKQQTQTKKQIFMGMITVAGLKKNVWSEELIQSEVNLDDFM